MAKVVGKDGEHVDKLLRRFKKKVETDGILKEVRKREYYVKPSVRKKLKRTAAAKRRRRSQQRQERPDRRF